MRANAILPTPATMTTSSPLDTAPTQAQALNALDQLRHQVATALFGPSQPPVRVGRFQVQKLLGAGGMGVVYAANDPQLGRTVALKLLQPLSAGERARERLLREAQAMARLQHPNVVAVHEAGVYGEQVYLVMEFVEDGTLGDWLRVRPRSWQEIVDVLTQAGEGLAAAHAAGLVHRDFKPSNILMGGGRARISDFGLARTAATGEEMERTSEDDGLLLASPLTRTGALLGTPAYMAPEQIHGDGATPASDQFAFGVVLYEAIVGHRPFRGESVAALVEAIDAGKITPARQLPPALMTVLRRALAPNPAHRFPDMTALLAALRRVRPTLGRPVVVSAALAAVLTGALVMFSAPPAPRDNPQPTAGVLRAAASLLPGERVSGPPDRPAAAAPEGAITCDAAATTCALDRDYARSLERDPAALFGDARHMPAVQDGRYLGHKLYGLRPGNPIKALGFKNGDLITAIDGVAVQESTFMAQVGQLLAHGGALSYERKGSPLRTQISIR